ncbi:hypothetical protein [Sphingobacterium sp. 2149]|uniref:hypothetical protein n=1 Tax=Sphingobacterium sp. 2149 TaxID=2817763 RepID=UPI001AE9A49D|nr:hypothetical protein [Sphingobacterium sp. 2149]MDR6735819.1 hypothetical protein [Sphingobacterium sp. 2149]
MVCATGILRLVCSSVTANVASEVQAGKGLSRHKCSFHSALFHVPLTGLPSPAPGGLTEDHPEPLTTLGAYRTAFRRWNGLWPVRWISCGPFCRRKVPQGFGEWKTPQ